MGWLVTLGLLALLAAVPLGVDLRYDEDGFLVKAVAWKLAIPVYPRPPKEKKPKQTKEEKPSKADSEAESLPQPPQPPKQKPAAKEKKGGGLTDFLPFVQLALDFLGDLRRKLRLDVLDIKLTLAGGDPADLAVNYGRVWAAIGNLQPQLERFFVIKKRNIDVQCDFMVAQTLVLAHVQLTITLGRLLSLALVYATRALKEYFTFKNKRKGGADL